MGNSRRCWRAKARGTPAGFPHRCAAAPLPAYRGPQQGPQCAPLRPTACAASPCVSPLRPPSGGDESPSVVRGVGHTGLRPFFPSPLPGAWVVPGQSRAAALSGGGPGPRCAAGRARHPLHPCQPFHPNTRRVQQPPTGLNGPWRRFLGLVVHPAGVGQENAL